MEALDDLGYQVQGDDVLTTASFPIRIDQRAMARDIVARNRMLNFFEGQQWEDLMKRNEWTVPYTGEQLATAAAEKKAFHTERKKWWQEKKDEVVAQIREGGITVTESIVDEMAKTGYATSIGRGGPVVEIDAALQAHLAEAHQKVHGHEAQIKEYDAWHQMMSSQRAQVFQLTQSDWMHFFGK